MRSKQTEKVVDTNRKSKCQNNMRGLSLFYLTPR